MSALALPLLATPSWTIGGIIFTLIGGLIIGLLGKLVAPGDRDSIPLWLTLLCGVAGMLIGTYVYTALGGSESTRGIDWLRHIVQVIIAAVLVVVAAGITGRGTKK